MLDLQELGIFHADLEFRNTIKLERGNGGFIYKIIDFDWAFKVGGSPKEKHLSLLSHTKAILKFWLNSDEKLQDQLFNYVLRYHDQILEQDSASSFVLSKIIKMLRGHLKSGKKKESVEEKVESMLG